MYIVTHDTHRQWQVSTKDILLFELDILIAKHRKKSTEETLRIEQMSQEGELLDSIELTVPPQDNIDNALEHFGVVVIDTPKRSKVLDSIKKLMHRFKR